MLDIQIQDIQHRLHNSPSIVRSLVSRKLADLVDMLPCHQRRELHDSHYHRERGTFDRHEGFVHVGAHRIRDGEELLSVLFAQDSADDFDEELLRVASSEVEAYRLENQPLEADDDLAGSFKELRGG